MASAFVFLLSWFFLPFGGFDWGNDIGPAARSWWPSPWVHGLPLAPWAATLLSPFGALPNRLATSLTNAICVLVLVAVARRYRGPEWTAILVLLTPPGYSLFVNGQTEWLTLLGLTFFNGIDPIFLLLKPQVAAGVLVSRITRAGRLWKKYLLPSTVFAVFSLVIWPAWPYRIWQTFSGILIGAKWNSSLWPLGILLGLLLLWIAMRTRDDLWGVVASPFLFPYVNLSNYLGLLIVLAARWPKWFVIAWALTWALGSAFYFLMR